MQAGRPARRRNPGRRSPAARSAKAIFRASAIRWQPLPRCRSPGAQVIAFQDVQHLDDMHARGGRRRPDDLACRDSCRAPAPARSCGQPRRSAAARRPPAWRSGGHDAPEGAAMQRAGAFAGDQRAAYRRSRPWTSRAPAGIGSPSGTQRCRCGVAVARSAAALRDTFDQVRRDGEAAGGEADRRLR